ncbi:hypothetical protein OsJ_36041 [Oryza sativa Japonica Group]|uniref:Uncharacterized protein n=1 Tax=Oryza sativa subsp. japonica TaxID=39947 RepID=B9GD24_ORYSJ|nr:hypothetical protein OsJ_36041 [Oryza sativa Japonica Group]
MSFAAVGTRIVGVGVELTTVYDPEASTERGGPRLVFPKLNPPPQQQQQDHKGTCAFDMDTEQWEMVHDTNLPFDGQALPLGSDDHRFVAAAADVAVYRMVVGISAVTGKKELTIVELRVVVASNCRIVPGNLLCAMGKGSFASFEF